MPVPGPTPRTGTGVRCTPPLRQASRTHGETEAGVNDHWLHPSSPIQAWRLSQGTLDCRLRQGCCLLGVGGVTRPNCPSHLAASSQQLQSGKLRHVAHCPQACALLTSGAAAASVSPPGWRAKPPGIGCPHFPAPAPHAVSPPAPKRHHTCPGLSCVGPLASPGASNTVSWAWAPCRGPPWRVQGVWVQGCTHELLCMWGGCACM